MFGGASVLASRIVGGLGCRAGRLAGTLASPQVGPHRIGLCPTASAWLAAGDDDRHAGPRDGRETAHESRQLLYGLLVRHLTLFSAGQFRLTENSSLR